MASRWLVVAPATIYFCGACGAATIILSGLMMSGTIESWFWVLLPTLLALLLVFVEFTVASVTWVVVAVKLCAGPVEVEYEGDSFNLENLFGTAKVCFLGHGYTAMLVLAACLLLFKLELPSWASCPIIYPLLPVAVLGSMHVFLAIMFKSPEVDAGRSSFIGMSMLGHVVMLTLKIDHYQNAESLPWALVFLPSWLTYGGCLVACAAFGAWGLSRLMQQNGAQSLPAGSSRDVPQAIDTKSLKSAVRAESILLAGVAAWAMGFCVSQVFITLRLDDLSKSVSWNVMLLPALVGWCVLVGCGAAHVKHFINGIIRIFLDAFGADFEDEDDEDQEPLLKAKREARNVLPWR